MSVGKDIFLIGVGVVVGALCTKSYFEKKYKDIADSEIASVKKAFNKIITDGEEESEKEEPKHNIPITETTSIDMEALKEAKDRIQYNGYSSIDDSQYERDILTVLAAKEHPTESDLKSPYIITQEEYVYGELVYNKIELSLYDDGALVSEIDDSLIDEENKIMYTDAVGVGNLKVFTEEYPEEPTMYIRNPGIATDYEVVKVGGNYAEVSGLKGGDDI